MNIIPQASAAGGSRRPWRFPVLAIVCAGLVAAGCSSSLVRLVRFLVLPVGRRAQGDRQRGLRLVPAVPQREGGRPGLHQGHGATSTRAAAIPPARWRPTSPPARSPRTSSRRSAATTSRRCSPSSPSGTSSIAGDVDGGGLQPQEQVRQPVQGVSRTARSRCTDLFTLLQTPGFKLGRTDPNIDPQGRDFIYMLELAQMHYHLPADTVSKILGTTDPARPTRRRSSPSPRWTRRCSPASWTRRAPSSPRRSSCTCPTSSCRPPINLGDRRRWPTSTPRRRSRSSRRQPKVTKRVRRR